MWETICLRNQWSCWRRIARKTGKSHELMELLPFMVGSPLTQISPDEFAGNDKPEVGSSNFTSNPGTMNPTVPGLDGPLPWLQMQCETVTQLYSVNPYAYRHDVHCKTKNWLLWTFIEHFCFCGPRFSPDGLQLLEILSQRPSAAQCPADLQRSTPNSVWTCCSPSYQSRFSQAGEVSGVLQARM